MFRTRLIPVLLLQNGLLVRSEKFSVHQVIGNPIFEVQRFNEWNVDELIYLDISSGDNYDQGREDHRYQPLTDPLKILEAVSRNCFMPLTWGGRLRTIEQVRECIRCGADKITLNYAAVHTPELITTAAKQFGSQAIVVSIDARRHEDGRYEVFTSGGTLATGKNPVEWAKEVEKRGAGEILLQSIDRDGAGTGYDLALIEMVSGAVQIPVIACSGVGRFEDYAEGVRAGAAAVAAANIWHFKEFSDSQGKQALKRAGVPVRI